jgi:hypothetical protein
MIEFLLDVVPWLAVAVLALFALGMMVSNRRSREIFDPQHVAHSLPLPLIDGVWQAHNSPATTLPSHGTNWLGQRYAIDIVGTEPGIGPTRVIDWRRYLWLEPPERFAGFGAPVIAPLRGVVVSAYSDAPDRLVCRSWLGLALFYATGLGNSLVSGLSGNPAGLSAMAGNHLILELDQGVYLALMHLQRGSLSVSPGDRVVPGQEIARLGNSGNTTQPHLHVQLMDSPEAKEALGVSFLFNSYEMLETGRWRQIENGMPETGALFQPCKQEA